LTGTITNEFGNFTKLKFVDLSSNQLMGPIPSTLFNTPVEFVYLSDNRLTGTVPSGFALATDLEDLYLFNNKLTGTVPAINTGQLAKLSELRVENNGITGTMPASICALELDTLISDCGGPLPQIRCDCCNSCVESP
jgi:Leucine-rich repeat (LRR) protein